MLPKFFQQHGTTLLEELGHLNDNIDDYGDDDILYAAEDFGTGLPDFFKMNYSDPSTSANYDSWMGAATGEDTLLEEELDPLEKELKHAQKELEMFSIDADKLSQPYQSTSVVISLSNATPAVAVAPSVVTPPVNAPPQTLSQGKKLEVGALFKGKKVIVDNDNGAKTSGSGLCSFLFLLNFNILWPV